MLQTSNIIWNLINLLVLIWFLYTVLSKPVGKAIKEKQEKTSFDLSNVEQRLTEITKKLENQSLQLDDVKKEIKKIEEKSREMSEKLKDEIIKAAHSEAEKVKENLKKNIEQSINKTKTELKAEVTEKALQKANEIVKQKLDKDMQMKLIKSFSVSLNKESSNN